MNWTMNTAQLEKGMMIRRPGLDESLEVVNVRNGQAKIKLPDGKTSTIPASAEVEWSRPESNPETASNPQPIHISDVVDASGWLTDWTLLDVGSKIAVLGEPGDFTILRLTDSNARIKHNATGQIQPLTIGHKFKILDTGSSSTANADKVTKDKGKAKGSKKPSAKPVSLPLEEPKPSDEELTAIENGNGDDDIEIESSDDEDLSVDPESLEDLEDEDTDTNEDDDASMTDTDTDDTDEEIDMPRPQTSTPAASKSRSTSLLTVGQISERTGISYPTLMRYIRDHGDRLPSEGEGRARRFLPESIDVFRQIRSETKGGRKPGSGSQSASKSAKPRRSTKPAQPIERSHETAAPYAAPARAQAKAAAQAIGSRSQSSVPSSTIDQALVSAIDHARAQISGLESLIDNLEAQREALKLWS